jgi:acyl-CoA synthetase (AMP-forming)/AMP-acid ligase II
LDINRIIERGELYWRDKIALIEGEKRFTFREINERANRLANGLISLGYRPGGHIGSLLRNQYQFVEVLFALYKLYAIRTSMATRLTQDDLAWIINDSEIETFIVDAEFLERIVSLKPALKNVKNYVLIGGAASGFIEYEEFIASQSPAPPSISGEENALGLSRIDYTAGTTGKPKGILASRHSELAVVRNLLIDTVPQISHQDVFIGLQPLYHAVTRFIVICWMRGATQVITHDFSAKNVLDLVQKEKVTVIKTVPTVLMRLIDYPEIEKYDLRGINTIIYGASPMPVEKLKKGLKLFGKVFIQNYGQGEAPMTISTLCKEDHRTEGTPEEISRLSSAGRPYTMVDVRIVDDMGHDVPIGALGEIIVQGDHIMNGYWHQPPGVTAETIKNGWVYTRDIGRFDEAGYLYLVDRKSEMIITGGLNVYPNEVEQILYKHPAIAEAAVFSTPDETWGESVAAAIAFKAGMKVTEEELIAFCRKALAGFKIPKRIAFHEVLPKSTTGKILRKELKEPYWKGRERKIN